MWQLFQRVLKTLLHLFFAFASLFERLEQVIRKPLTKTYETKGQKSERACDRNKESASKQATAVLIKTLFALNGSFAEKRYNIFKSF